MNPFIVLSVYHIRQIKVTMRALLLRKAIVLVLAGKRMIMKYRFWKVIFLQLAVLNNDIIHIGIY